MGKGVKSKKLMKRIILCEECLPKYWTKYTQKECKHEYICKHCKKAQ